MEIPEIYNNIIICDFFDTIKIFNLNQANINKVFYININKFVIDYKPTVHNAVNLYQNYLQISQTIKAFASSLNSLFTIY